MTELVTITPGGGRTNSDGDPIAAGGSFPVRALVAPGNTTRERDLDAVDFTVYMPQRVRVNGGGYVRTVDALTETFLILVRGKLCRGRAQLWDEGGRGGVVVLALARTGQAAL